MFDNWQSAFASLKKRVEEVFANVEGIKDELVKQRRANEDQLNNLELDNMPQVKKSLVKNQKGLASVTKTVTDQSASIESLTQFKTDTEESLAEIKQIATQQDARIELAVSRSASAKSTANEAKEAATSMYVNGVVQYYVDWGKGLKFTVDDTHVLRHIHIEVKGGVTVQNIAFLPQLEKGETATEWTPYVDVTAVSVSSCGKNILPYPYYEPTRTVNGVTLTVNEDGSINLNGTATDKIQFFLLSNDAMTHLRGTYTLSAQGAVYTGGNNVRIAVATYKNGTATYSGVAFGSQATYVFTETYQLRHVYIQVDSGAVFTNYTLYPQIELGNIATEYEQYKAGQTIAVSDGKAALELASISPCTAIIPDREGVILSAEYNRDANTVISEYEKRLARLEALLAEN